MDEAAVRRALDAITGPAGKGLLAAGMVGGIAVAGDKVTIALEVDPAIGRALEPLKRQIEIKLRALPGIGAVTVVPTARGPSMQRVLGVTGRPETTAAKTILPKLAHGLKVMSMGFLIPEDTATIWRGPMVMGAIQQLLRDVEWGTLDILVVDMPPGTGDAQLTLTQTVPLAGAVIVSTPQDLALIDAARGLAMFRKVEVPILGIVENMSTFICPNCRHETPIFGHGGARAEAERLGVAFLGEVPLDMAIRVTSDAGTPIVVDQPAGPHAAAYRAVAERVLAALEAGAGERRAPLIRVE